MPAPRQREFGWRRPSSCIRTGWRRLSSPLAKSASESRRHRDGDLRVPDRKPPSLLRDTSNRALANFYQRQEAATPDRVQGILSLSNISASRSKAQHGQSRRAGGRRAYGRIRSHDGRRRRALAPISGNPAADTDAANARKSIPVCAGRGHFRAASVLNTQGRSLIHLQFTAPAWNFRRTARRRRRRQARAYRSPSGLSGRVGFVAWLTSAPRIRTSRLRAMRNIAAMRVVGVSLSRRRLSHRKYKSRFRIGRARTWSSAIDALHNARLRHARGWSERRHFAKVDSGQRRIAADAGEGSLTRSVLANSNATVIRSREARRNASRLLFGGNLYRLARARSFISGRCVTAWALALRPAREHGVGPVLGYRAITFARKGYVGSATTWSARTIRTQVPHDWLDPRRIRGVWFLDWGHTSGSARHAV